MTENFKLDCIRRGTAHDLSDAKALAARAFGTSQNPAMDRKTFELSKNLFIAVAMETAYSKVDGMFSDMLDFLVHPGWDCAAQIIEYFQRADETFQQKEAAVWHKAFIKMIGFISNEKAEILIKRCYIHWKSAVRGSGISAQRKVRPRGSVQVFDSEAVARAAIMTAGLSTEKKAAAELLIEKTQVNEGFRTVPNAKKAWTALEKVKGAFENLAEPINRLQSRLVLASCMKPDDFYVPPILLLGDPGIGKTHLAMQLAKSLGVQMEKISAGGAQGAFQFTGSHTSWTSARPGSLLTLLAVGKSASPVVIVDEVDKIRDAQYPVLPVLLDLLERETAKQFKDEFFEMPFDASKVIFVLTANNLDGVPTSLTSRCEIFNVPRPLPNQRLRIIEEIANTLRIKTGMPIMLDSKTSAAVSNRMDIDLREVARLVEEAFAKAIQARESVAFLREPKFAGKCWGNFATHRKVEEVLH